MQSNAPTIVSSGGSSASYVEEYVQVIKSCFSKDSVIGPYFYQLIDYLQSDSTSESRMNPVPSAIRLRASSDLIHQTYAPATQPWGLDIPEKNVTQTQAPCLITIEGLPSPSCVAYLGSKYGLRPEYWLGHLSLGRQSPTHDKFFELPALPSRRGNIVQVLIPFLGRRTGSSYATHVSAIERLQAQQKLEEWDRHLFQNKKFGATRLRKLHLHSSQYFSIEQLVSFTVCTRTPNSWVGIFLVDQGLGVPETQDTPWSKYTRNRQAPDFLPILSYNESPSGYEIQSTAREMSPSTPNPFHPRDHVRVASDKDLDLLRESPFAVLASLLGRAAAGWAQILNFIDSDIDKCKIPGPSPTTEALGSALEQLRFNLDFLAHAEQSLKDNAYLIEWHGSRTWPGHQEYQEATLGAELASTLLLDTQYSQTP
ncbi:hypothetical protein MBR_10408, partial [Metarhizium brunneum ARSEF 3297]